VSALVIDANILIDVFRGNEAARLVLATANRAGDELWSSTIVRVEVLGAMRAPEVDATQALLGMLSWLPVTTEIADAAAGFARRYRSSHSGIDAGDYIVAATADHIGARLMTRNIRHFPMFEGLETPY
jgi:hypothetical protein